MEQASGQDLSWFFRQWLNRSGVPAVEGNWHYDSAAKQVVVTVKQTQTADTYRFSLGVGIAQTPGALPKVHRMQVTGRETKISLPVENEPVSVTLDPGVWLLADFGSFTKTSAGTR